MMCFFYDILDIYNRQFSLYEYIRLKRFTDVMAPWKYLCRTPPQAGKKETLTRRKQTRP